MSDNITKYEYSAPSKFHFEQKDGFVSLSIKFPRTFVETTSGQLIDIGPDPVSLGRLFMLSDRDTIKNIRGEYPQVDPDSPLPHPILSNIAIKQ
jgi:hypothetical protein